MVNNAFFSKLQLLFAALKPERMLTSHVAMFVGIAIYYASISEVGPFLLALVSFLFFYGAMYLLNDIADLKIDQSDPHNKGRVIAAGKLSIQEAYIAAFSILFATGFVMYLYSSQLFLVALVLLIMNVAYSWYLKSIAYLDVLFIALTQPIKYLLALALCGVGFTAFSSAIPLLVVIYLVAVSMHAEKQLGKLVVGRRRQFKFGEYSSKVLRMIRNAALTLSVAALVFALGQVGFWWAVLIVGVEILARVKFSAEEANTLVSRLEKTFQPR